MSPRMPPSSRAAMQRKPSTESDFWAGLFLDLSVRVEWLEQTLDAVPKEEASAAALVRLHSYARALHELHQALARVQAHRADPHFKALFSLEGPLAAYLSRLYAWCETIGDEFERVAVALRRRQPTTVVFSHRAVNDSYSQFAALVASMRKASDAGRVKDEQAWRAFDEDVEELIWATEWVHMALARPPGG